MNRPDVVVAVDGSLYRFHPHFHDLMVEKITDLVNPGIKVLQYVFLIFDTLRGFTIKVIPPKYNPKNKSRTGKYVFPLFNTVSFTFKIIFVRSMAY